MKHPENPITQLKGISAKAAYSKCARSKLTESRARLDGVSTAIQQAIATGRLTPSEQLDRARNAVEVNFATVETRLRALQKSGEGEWDELRYEVDSAWENLAHSIKNLVTRFSDESGGLSGGASKHDTT